MIAGKTNPELVATLDLLRRGAKGFRLLDGGAVYFKSESVPLKDLEAAAARWSIEIRGTRVSPHGAALALKAPRIALYQAYGAPMDEGWTRWIFEQYGIGFTTVRNQDLRAGGLNARFDAVIIPDGPPNSIVSGGSGRGGGGEGREGRVPPEYTGGIGQEGVKNLVDFATAGGTVLFFNQASGVCVQHFPGCGTNVLASVPEKDFYGPGSLLSAAVDVKNPIALGADAETPIFFERSPAFNLPANARAVATYTRDNPLLSGWLLGGEKLKGSAALAEVPVGQGRAILFGFRPQYRAQSEVTYKLILNSLLYASATREEL